MNAPTVSFVGSKHATAILSYSCSCPNLRAKKASPQKIRAKIATAKGIPVNPIRLKKPALPAFRLITISSAVKRPRVSLGPCASGDVFACANFGHKTP